MNDLIPVTTQPPLPDGFIIARGWSKWVMEQLTHRSIEPEMKIWVPKDSTERFSTIETAIKWGERDEHVVYSLVNGQELAGIVWFTKYDTPKVEDAEYTFAIRMYEGARGKGLSSSFAQAALDDLAEYTGYEGKVWLETGVDNEIALRLYHRLGFETSVFHGDRVTLIRPAISK